MKYLLDTNVCVHNLRTKGRTLAKLRLGIHPPSDLALCSIVVAELRYGAEGGTDPVWEHSRVAAFVAQFASFPFDDVAASVYGRVRHDLQTRGLVIGGTDLLIAAIALASNLTLVTHNTSEFSRVTGLALEDWEIP